MDENLKNEFKVQVAIMDIEEIKHKLLSHSQYIRDFTEKIDRDLGELDKLLEYLKSKEQSKEQSNETQR
jgi:hypothetical protein